MNTTSENMTYLVDNKTNMCKHNKLHPLTDRKLEWISETMYRDIEQIIHQDSQKYINSEGGYNLSNHKLTHCEIEYDQFCCSDCAQLLCLEIKNKMSALKKLYNLVKTLNINDHKKGKVLWCFN